jgi:hypothetical protein
MGCKCAGNQTADQSFTHVKEMAIAFSRVIKADVVIYNGADGLTFKEKLCEPFNINVIYTIAYKA